MSELVRKFSKIASVPGLHLTSPAANRAPSAAELAGYLKCQRLAREAVRQVASLMQPGWTEKHAASMVNAYLADKGVKSYFHRSFAWFGERARFDGIRGYRDFSPSDRRLAENEIFILDVAPIFGGYTCDIGYTSCLGENPQWVAAEKFLKGLRKEIPILVSSGMAGDQLWREIDRKIKEAGYDNRHKKYPFAVLGHRVHRVPEGGSPVGILNFGWQSFWSLASRGLFGQLLGPDFQGDMTGLWAIEPHIGGPGFGAKFEEILVVENGQALWLDAEGVLS